MNPTNVLGGLDDSERLFARHISDLARLSEKRYSVEFSSFLTEREQCIAEAVLKKDGFSDFRFSDGDRKVAAVGEGAFEAEFPIVPVTFTFRAADGLSHRDILGAAMALGIKREMIGDISVAETYAIVYAYASIAETVLSIDKIGRAGVKAARGELFPRPEAKFLEIGGTVSSLRLDAIIAEAVRLSREKSASLIKSGCVVLSGSECTEVSEKVDEGAVFTVKGYGKFILAEVGGVSKKGKTHINIKKYC